MRYGNGASTAAPVLRALSVMTSSKKRDQGCALDPRGKEVKIKGNYPG
jgi:hypothetical protein